jgi:hypothetical protein
MTTFLIGFAVAAIWVLSLYVHPFGRCWRCWAAATSARAGGGRSARCARGPGAASGWARGPCTGSAGRSPPTGGGRGQGHLADHRQRRRRPGPGRHRRRPGPRRVRRRGGDRPRARGGPDRRRRGHRPSRTRRYRLARLQDDAPGSPRTADHRPGGVPATPQTEARSWRVPTNWPSSRPASCTRTSMGSRPRTSPP